MDAELDRAIAAMPALRVFLEQKVHEDVAMSEALSRFRSMEI
jgi:flagellar biosynthesis/type III secretory pathway ATPase